MYNLSKDSQTTLLNVSDIATYVGQNKWNTIEKFESLWKKCSPISYRKAIDYLEKNNISSLSLQKTPEEILRIKIGDDIVNQIKKENNVDYTTKINELNTSAQTKEKLILSAKSIENRYCGIRRECGALDYFEKEYNVKVDRSQKLIQKNINKIRIFGRLDGLYNEKIIVEVKNRMNGFFDSLRDYEKTQIQMYMWITGLDESKLVEQYQGKIKVTEIKYDNEYMEIIIKKLNTYLDNFYIFINDENKMNQYVLMNDNEKKIFISNF